MFFSCSFFTDVDDHVAIVVLLLVVLLFWFFLQFCFSSLFYFWYNHINMAFALTISFLFRDLNKIEEGIGHKIGMMLQAITTVLVGFIMGFVYGWKLTLVMIAASPLVVIAGGILGKVT